MTTDADRLVAEVKRSIPEPRPPAPYLDPASAAFYGIAGEVVRTLAPHTEADPAALLFLFHAVYGAMMGGRVRSRVGFADHPPAIYLALVGRTGQARKDSARADAEGLFRRVDDGWAERHRVGGFGSGEAFIEHAAQNPGEAIFLVESELSRVLAVAAREGSTVSSVLRCGWDFQPMEHRVRKNPYVAPPAPVVLVGNITIPELRDPRHGLRAVDTVNGFGNRLLWVYVDRRRVDPHLRPVPDSIINPLVRAIRDRLAAARQGPSIIERSREAEELWGDLYQRLAADDGAGMIDALTARGDAQLLRLSLLYAVEDAAPRVEPIHLQAAWECWRYARWSAQHIFVGQGTGDPDLDRIAAVLGAGEELSGRELDQMFAKNRSTADLRRKAIEAGIAEEVDARDGRPGRPRKVLRGTDNTDKPPAAGWWTGSEFHLSVLSEPLYQPDGERDAIARGYVAEARRAGQDPARTAQELATMGYAPPNGHAAWTAETVRAVAADQPLGRDRTIEQLKQALGAVVIDPGQGA
jgi:hypothetical protein